MVHIPAMEDMLIHNQNILPLRNIKACVIHWHGRQVNGEAACVK